MKDEYYHKHKLEEMRKRNRYLADLKDIGMMIVSELGFIVERSYNPLGVTKDDVDELGDYLKDVKQGMIERWSE